MMGKKASLPEAGPVYLDHDGQEGKVARSGASLTLIMMGKKVR